MTVVVPDLMFCTGRRPSRSKRCMLQLFAIRESSSWKEKVECKKGSVVEKVMTGEGVGRRPRGRPRKRWRDPF